MIFRIIMALALATAVQGCTVTTYMSPDGARFSRTSIGTDTVIEDLHVEVGADGSRKLDLKGGTNQSDAIRAAAEGAARGAMGGGL